MQISKISKFKYAYLRVNKQSMFMQNVSSLSSTQTDLAKFHNFQKILKRILKNLMR
jgi:hypothetical protein